MNSFECYLGFVIICLALVVRIWAQCTRNTWDAPMTQPNEFCTDGPYRYVRHPAYAAYLWIGAAVGLMTHSWTTYAFIALLFLVLNYVARQEERMLNELWGAIYLKYEQKTWRFTPFLY